MAAEQFLNRAGEWVTAIPVRLNSDLQTMAAVLLIGIGVVLFLPDVSESRVFRDLRGELRKKVC